MSQLPRVVVAAPGSGHGKTTVATGLMAALTRRGTRVSGHKIGPDYIDPGYHAMATGRPGRNLDAHLVGEARLVPLLLHGAATPVPAQVAVIEGVMGLFDGAVGRAGFASTAHVAGLIQAPVVLVIDISHTSRTAAAVVHGLHTFDDRVRVGGVILNRVGSPRHADEVREALSSKGFAVLGQIPRDADLRLPSRHLGLVPAAEYADAARAVARLADQVDAHVDLAAVLRLARSAPPLPGAAWDPAAEVGAPVTGRPVVAIASGPAFTFRYPETAELLHAAGCEVAEFDPLSARELPAGTQALHLGGGFPQVHAGALGDNRDLLAAVGAAVRAGLPTVAECAGMLYLCTHLDHTPMAGVLPARGEMSPRLTLGYRTATAAVTSVLAEAGEVITAHEHHRTIVHGQAPASSAWTVQGRAEGICCDPAGSGRATVHASYLHVHWAGYPHLAARLARAAAGAATAPRASAAPHQPAAVPPAVVGEPDLNHHGDAELAPGLVDLAVNVSGEPWPPWLREALVESLDQARAYPHAQTAQAAVAARHSRDSDEVLLTAGAAEAFTLAARARAWRHPVVVHPQFTEPEVALRAAGHQVHRVLLNAQNGFRLDPRAVPEAADLVVIGNPTNPTGVLHPRSAVLELLAPGRLVVVDEAFMDAVPGEPQSLSSQIRPGLAIVRSLTKTWSVPGVRAGYLLGAPDELAEMAAHQPPWSVSAAALAVLGVCSSEQAVGEAQRRACTTSAQRAELSTALAATGLEVVTSHAPFVLARGPVGLREQLRQRGFAVRRGETFPGLGVEWMRITAREADSTHALAEAIRSAMAPGARR